MGSFDGTCAVTRLAIREGEEVLLIACTKESRINSTYELHQEFLGRRHRKERLDETIDSLQEFIISLNESLGEDIEALRKQLLADNIEIEKERNSKVLVCFGTYDGYGWIKEIENDWDKFDQDTTCFVRLSTARRIVEWMHTGLDDSVNVAEAITSFARRTRIQLLGNTLAGSQYADKFELEAQSLLIEGIIPHELDKLYQYLSQYDEK